jgi:RNA polymerase primary sigma factor
MRQLKITTQITNRDSQAFDTYLHEIGKMDLVSPEQEVVLTQRIKAGDQKALEQLVNANLRFVVSVSKQYQHQGLSLLDLINEGNIGLIKAASRFDETKGFKFISYAIWWIRQAIMQALMEQSRLVRLPLNKASNYSKLHLAMIQFEQENEREPAPEEIAAIMQVELTAIADLMNDGSKRHLSMDAPLASGEDLTFGDLLEDATLDKPDKGLLLESLRKEIKIAMGLLNPREARIVKYFFGLDSYPLSLEEIACKFALTKERVRQIKEKALAKIRRTSQGKQLKFYLG